MTEHEVAAVVVTVGNELLYGMTVDRNAAWLGERLSELGCAVVERVGVGDEEERIRRAIFDALGRADIVIVTGGLGSTLDDVTRQGVAAAFDRKLLEDPKVLGELEARFQTYGRGDFPLTNRRQALVPEGAELLPNRHGTASGLALAENGKLTVVLPGVPLEMQGIFEEEVDHRIRDLFQGRLQPVRHRTLRTTGIAESALAQALEPRLEALKSVEVAFLPSLHSVALRLTVRTPDVGRAEELLDRAEQILSPSLAGFRIEDESVDLVEAVARVLKHRRLTLATAESCTGGLLAKRLTDRAGSSAYFGGSVVAYQDEVKVAVLGVDPETLAKVGAVSREVAEGMALGVAERLSTDVGIGITGVAGPGGGTGAKPVGTVWYAAALEGEVRSTMTRFPGNREAVRERSAQAALNLLYRWLLEVQHEFE